MKSNSNIDKKVTIISVTALVLGLLIQLSSIFAFAPYPWVTNASKVIRVLSPNINLSFMSNHMFQFYNFRTGLDINFLDISIYILILIGVIVYLNRRGKEIRLLRMSFSIILITKIISILSLIVAVSGGVSQTNQIFLSILLIISNLFWLLCSLYVVKKLSENLKLQEKSKKFNTVIDYVDTPKIQRFLHHTLDLFLSLAICSDLVVLIFSGFLNKVDVNLAVFVVLIASKLFYLVFFEFIFHATPAKFLTGSRVIMKNGDNISLQTAFFRNLSRHVPFEAFSYLGTGNGWHDKWLNTRVVKEENIGVPLKKYSWIFLIFLVLGILGYTGHRLWDKFDNYHSQKAKYEQKTEEIEHSLNNLSNEHFIKLEGTEIKVREFYYMKVDTIMEHSIVFKYFKMNDYSPSVYEVEKYYEAHKEGMLYTEVLKTDLENSFTKDYDDFNDNRSGYNFFPETKKNYFIVDIFRGYKPNITLYTYGDDYNREIISILMENDGWPAELTQIKNLEGDLNWLNKLPQKINAKYTYSTQGEILRAENFEYGKVYKFEFTIKDSLGREEKIITNFDEIMRR